LQTSSAGNCKLRIDCRNDVKEYLPLALFQQVYYPYGMLQPNRQYNANEYRYGFNGKENDNEIKGQGNHQDYGLRIYDPILGKFFSVDPLFKKFPWNSSYAFAENDVIRSVDLDGAERHPYQYLPQWAQNSIQVADGIGEGLDQLAHDLSPIRPSDENDPKSLSEALDRMKNIPSDLMNMPSTLAEVYENGSLKEKTKATVGLLGTVAALKRGKANSSSTMLNVVKSGYNPKTRILTFLQGTKNKIQQSVKVPDGFDPVKIDGAKAEVFKQKGKNTWISPDLDSHTGGIWKMATGKAENILHRETRSGTYNSDLTKRVGD
jgi:RHS repeat-associated protein